MKDSIDRHALEATLIALSVLMSIFAVVHVVLAFVFPRIRATGEYVWFAACYVFALAAALLYIYLLRAFFRASDVGNGLKEPYPTILDDGVFIQKSIFAITIFYWSSLWSAKMSLLCLSRKLLIQLPYYIRLWWAVIGICAVAYVGCIVTLFLSCSSMEAWFTANSCQTPRDVVASNVSRYFSFGVDVFTNVLIMLLPLRLIITLQMPVSRKISISGLFCLGVACIIAAAIRCTQVGEASAQPTMPWLALFGTLETTIAVMVCSGPSLYRALKASVWGRKAYYEEPGNSNSKSPSNGHSRSSGIPYARTHNKGQDANDVRLKQYPRAGITNLDHDDNSSEEGLVGLPVTGSTQASVENIT